MNLINMNVNRIHERLSEIGIRKSFGADNLSLAGQFLTENIILTLIGGLLAVLLSIGVLLILRGSGVLPDHGLLLNLRVLVAGLLFSLTFGFISGFLPAFRMSRLQIIESLKKGEA